MECSGTLPLTWRIPNSIRVRVGDSAGRQRVIHEENHLLLVLHRPPQAGDTHRVGRFLWRDAQGNWTASDGSDGPAVLTKHIGQYAALITKFDQLEEDAHTAQAYFEVIEGLLPLIRSTSHLHQVLQDARKLVPEDRNLINARDQAYEMERNADLLYTSAKNGLDFEIAKRAEEEATAARAMARSTHRLNVLAGLFFPLATISSVMGIDSENFSPGQWINLALVVVGGLVIGLILVMFITTGRLDATAAVKQAKTLKRKRQ